MTHDRDSELVRHLQRQIEWCNTPTVAGIHADPYLDTDNGVRVSAGNLQAGRRIQQAEIPTLADHHFFAESKDAGKGNIQKRKNPGYSRLDNVFEKPPVIGRTRRTRVDQGGGSRLERIVVGIDTDRRTAPVHVCMQVNETRGHDQPCHIPNLV